MSNSGEEEPSGEEEHLSTPTEEESIEDAVKDDEDEDNHEVEEERVAESNGNLSAEAEHPQTKKTNNIESVTMTRSDSSPPNLQISPDESKMPRRIRQISEENLILKRQLKKQEERIKVLATKLIRVISERNHKTKREEILQEEQKSRIVDLEHEVSNLRDKLQVSKQQLSSYTKLIPNHPLGHHHPPSRQTSMLSSSTITTTHSKLNKKPRSARSVSGGGGVGSSHPPRPSTATSSSHGNLLIDKNFADRVEELLLEAKAENQALEDQLKNCRQRLISTEDELLKAKEDLKRNHAEHQEEVLTIKSQLGKEQDIVKKKKQLSDNIQLIRLQRESRRTASWLSTLEAQCLSLESRLAASTENASQLETQLTEVQDELGQEQQKSITLQKQLEDATSSLNRLKELEAQIGSLQEENKILKEANDSLLKKAFSVTEKAEKAESAEISLKVQMNHLETVLKSEMKMKQEIQESLRVEKERSIRLEFTNEGLQETLDKLKDEINKYKSKEFSEMQKNQDTPSIVPTGSDQQNEGCVASGCPHLSKSINLEDELTSFKLQLAALKDEHSNTKIQLDAQMTANDEYQREIDTLTSKLDAADDFHHKKLQNFVKVLEERTRQISHLEKFIDEWKSKQAESCVVCGNCMKNSTNANKNEVSEKGDDITNDEDVSHLFDVNSQELVLDDKSFHDKTNEYTQ